MERPIAHSLSYNKIVGGWGYPRLDKIDRPSTATCALENNAPYSASETAAHTTGIRVEWQKNWAVEERRAGSAKVVKTSGGASGFGAVGI